MAEQHLSSRQGISSTPRGPGRTGRSMAGERRVITVLFCDVVSSTRMSEGLDPEAAAAIYANAEAAAQYAHAIDAAGRLGVSDEDLSGLYAIRTQVLELCGRDEEGQQL